ncbi:unnamed protein product, partial [marine sediment metagenome]
MANKRNSHRFCATPGCINIVSKKNRKKGAICSVCLGKQKEAPEAPEIPVVSEDPGIVKEAVAEVAEDKPKSALSEKMAALRKLTEGDEQNESQ